MVVTREKGGWGEVVKGNRGQIYDDGRRSDFGGWTHNVMHVYRWCIIKLYTWNLYNFINQCQANEFKEKSIMGLV